MSEQQQQQQDEDPPPKQEVAELQQQEEEEDEAFDESSHCAPMIPLAATASYLLEDYDFSLRGIMDSISKHSFLDREISTTDHDTIELPRMIEEVPSRKEFLDKLVQENEGTTKWMQVKQIQGKPVQRLANIPYASESPMQSLDLYFPHGRHSGPEEETEAEQQPVEEPETTDKKRPVYIHIHGGGWSRGGKDSPFYGGPAMCQNAVADAGNCIGVAVGYRTGKYPGFVRDAALAVKWVYDNVETMGGDVHNVFLSGHSAGGHISSLLILRHDAFLEPLGIPMSFFKGLVLVSGVYDLFSPMKNRSIDVKNKWFALAYALPAFGTDSKLKREASPLLLLDPDKDISLMGGAMKKVTSNLPSLSLKKRFPKLAPSKLLLLSSSYRSSTSTNISDRSSTNSNTTNVVDSNRSSNTENSEESGHQQSQQSVEWNKDDDAVIVPLDYQQQQHDLPPPTLILNATYDMGLQENGQLFAEALSEYTPVRYMIIEGSDHASICWNETTSRVVADFINLRKQVVVKKKRRGKRDK